MLLPKREGNLNLDPMVFFWCSSIHLSTNYNSQGQVCCFGWKSKYICNTTFHNQWKAHVSNFCWNLMAEYTYRATLVWPSGYNFTVWCLLFIHSRKMGWGFNGEFGLLFLKDRTACDGFNWSRSGFRGIFHLWEAENGFLFGFIQRKRSNWLRSYFFVGFLFILLKFIIWNFRSGNKKTIIYTFNQFKQKYELQNR